MSIKYFLLNFSVSISLKFVALVLGSFFPFISFCSHYILKENNAGYNKIPDFFPLVLTQVSLINLGP